MVQTEKQGAGPRRSPPDVEVTALVSRRTIAGPDVARIAAMLEDAGFHDITPARIIISRSAAKRVASGHRVTVQATIVADETAASDAVPQSVLKRALDAAAARGNALKKGLRADRDMLSSAGMAERLGMSEEGVRLKRKRHEVLGLELAKRGIRYPAWQLMEDHQLLPELPRLFEVLGPDPWTIYRFLLQHHAELDGLTALDALKRGRIVGVLAAARNIASGAFA
jgi:hypothetical protein